MFKVRLLLEEDYVELCKWWQENRFPVPSQDMLPDNGACGVMVYKDEINVAAGFLYFTNSKITWIEFIVANFQYKNKDRAEAIQMVIENLTEIARRKGFKAVFSSLKKDTLMKHFEACGYSKGSCNASEMIIVL